jgi:hypothetical protein
MRILMGIDSFGDLKTKNFSAGMGMERKKYLRRRFGDGDVIFIFVYLSTLYVYIYLYFHTMCA